MKKQEFEITFLFAMELINKFQSEELARVFTWKYNDFYKGGSKEEKAYEDIISLVYQYVENAPDYNRLDFTQEMKEVMRGWKGKNLQSYIENADDGYVTVVRLCVDEQDFDLNNEYMAYWNSRDDISELTCFSCVEKANNEPLLPYLVRGKCKEIKVDEKIVKIYIIKDTERGENFNSRIPYEMTFETALIIQTATRCYAFWRNLIFNTIETVVCDTMEEALKKIRSVEEIQAEAQEENPYAVTVERQIEEL